MHLFVAAAAASPTAADRLAQIPLEFWWKFAVGIAAVVAAVVVLRKIAKVNTLFLGLGVMMVTSFVGFSWIYERNEPAWATPTVQWMAAFFPSKGTAARW